MLLSQLNVGEERKIKKIECSLDIKSRLAYMGVTEKTTVTIVRVSPFNDPIEIKVRGFYLALRKSEADKIVLYDE